MSVNISRAEESAVDTYLDTDRTYGGWSNEVKVWCSAAINHRIEKLKPRRRLDFESEPYENDKLYVKIESNIELSTRPASKGRLCTETLAADSGQIPARSAPTICYVVVDQDQSMGKASGCILKALF